MQNVNMFGQNGALKEQDDFDKKKTCLVLF